MLRLFPLLALSTSVFIVPFTLAETNDVNESNLALTGGSQEGQANLDYIGDKARIGVGINDDFHLVAELLYATDVKDDSTWIGEAWVNRGAGGLKLNYHWLVEADEEEDGKSPRVFKLFGAVDQNRDEDRKITLGAGLEKERLFFSGHLSAAITGRRSDGQSVSEFTQTITGFENERAFSQLETTTTTTSFFKHPYDYGAGLRLGHFYDQSLFRVQMGLDYEIGDYDSSQATLSLGVEKFFTGSGHSLALTVEHFKKDGDFENQSTDTRGVLLWRYSFGENYQPTHITRQVQQERDVAAVAAVTETKLVRERLDLGLETLFGLDQSQLTERSESLLQKIARRLETGNIIGKISIVGHTCDLGSEEYNLQLSEQRAQSAKEKLVALGFDPDQIITEGRGESQPKVTNDSEANRRLNRRVRIQFLQMVEEEVEVTAAVPATTEMVWVEEPVENPPAWIRRSLLNPAQHKRVVDVYQYEKESVEVAFGERQFINTAPQAADDTIAMQRNSAASVIDVLANDRDADEDAITIVSVTQPANGIVDNFGDLLTYQANPGFAGNDSFTYTISDGNGEEATASVTVAVTNAEPVTNADSATTSANQRVLINVLANDSDEDNDSLTITSFSQPGNGTAAIVDNQISYTPNDSFIGEDTFTYVSSDGLATTVGDVAVTVVANLPQAAADSASTDIDTPVLIDVLANDQAALGGDLTILSTSQPGNGSASINGGQILYTPNGGFEGSDTFSYTIQEGTGLTQSAEVIVVVGSDAGDNQPPNAVDDRYNTRIVDPSALDVLANDSDPDGDPLTIVGLENLPPTNLGAVSINSDNTLRFTARADWDGTELEFTYIVEDGKGGRSTATVRVKC